MGMSRRRVYSSKHSLEEARAAAVECAIQKCAAEHETLPVAESLGRVLAEPVLARFSVPIADVAAMDGVAVSSAAVRAASESNPVVLQLGETVCLIDTGQPLPAGCDAVVMIEYADVRDDGSVVLTAAVRPWQHVRLAGEDIAAGEMLLDEGSLIRPVDQGAMLAAGITEAAVWPQPTVGILPTGDELVVAGTKPRPGQLVEFNSVVLSGLVTEWGGRPMVYPFAKDEPESLKERIAKAAGDCSVLLVLGGSSAGRRDFVRDTIAALGEVRVEAVAVTPGKPTVIGVIGSTPVLGMPGYPVSCMVAATQFLSPILATLLHRSEPVPDSVPTRFVRKVPSKLGQEEFVRVRLTPHQDGTCVARPMPRGAGAVTSMLRADAVVRIPRQIEGYKPDFDSRAELLRPRSLIDNRLPVAGCWEPAIDIIARLIRRPPHQITLTHDDIGSLAGIDALRRGETAFAACAIPLDDTGIPRVFGDLAHILDTTGYQLEFIAVCVRRFGLVVAEGNPKNVTAYGDLAMPNVTLANRRNGSMTRSTLDHALRELDIAQDNLAGYTRKNKNQLAAAAAVLSGIADVALGAESAAMRLSLGFIPLGTEAVFLAYNKGDDISNIENLKTVLDGRTFRTELASQPAAYRTEHSGQTFSHTKLLSASLTVF